MQRYTTGVLFAAFAVGIGVCGLLPGAVWASGALVLAGAGLFFMVRGGSGLSAGPWAVVAFVAVVFFSGGWRASEQQARLEATLAGLPWYRSVEYRARVSVVPQYGGEKVKFIKFDKIRFGGSGDFPADFSFSMPVPLSDTLRPGDEVAGRAVLLPLRAPLDVSEPDFQAIGHREGTLGQWFDLGHRKVGQADFSGDAFRYGVRDFVERSLVRCGVEQKAAELTLAVILGDKGAVDPDTRRAYQLSGAMHLLVVSGLHVAVIAGILFGLTFFLARRRVLRAAMVLGLLWGYGYLVGYPPPVVRALWMFSVLTLSGLAGGRYFSFGALCLAGLADLVVRPEDLYSVGFQMSYAATAAVIVSYGWIGRLCRGMFRPVGFVCRLVLVSLAAQVALLPFVLYYFDYLNLLFPVSNLLLVPAVSYLLIPAGILLIGLSAVGISVPVLSSAYNALADFCNTVAGEVAGRDFAAVSGVELSLAGFLFSALFCTAVLVVYKRRAMALFLALAGGVLYFGVRLGGGDPYPYLGKWERGYAVAVEKGCYVALEENSLVRVEGRSVLFLPGGGAKYPDGGYLLVAGDFKFPEKKPQKIILLSDVWWQQTARWKEYGRKEGVPVYDMREKGYYVFGDE